MSGYVGDLSDTQEKALKEIKELIFKWLDQNEDSKKILVESKATYFYDSDADLLRFLRARKFDVKKTFAMWENCIRFRINFQGKGVHKIEWDSIQTALNSKVVLNCDYDKEDRPVVIIRVNAHSTKDRDLEEWERLDTLMIESCRMVLRAPTYTYTLIFDMEGFAMKNMDYNLVKFLISAMQENYPEYLGVCLVVNSPWVFNTCWTLIKNWLDPNTAKKVFFVKRDQLGQYLNEDTLKKANKIMDAKEDLSSELEDFKTQLKGFIDHQTS